MNKIVGIVRMEVLIEGCLPVYTVLCREVEANGLLYYSSFPSLGRVP